MAAANTDKLKKVSRKWVGQVGSGGITDAVVDSFNITTTNLPTDTAVVVVVDRVDSSGTATAAKEETIIGVVSGNSLISCVRGAEGTAQAHAAGAVVEVLLTAKGWNDIIDAFLVAFNQNGTIKSGTVLTVPQINDTSSDHQYIFSACELTADRTVTLPLLTAGDEFVFKAHTQTLTNKRVTPRVVTATDDATAAIDCDVTDQYQLTAVANATTFTVTGTPINGQKLIIRLKDAGVAKDLTWTGFTAIGVTLPTTTVANKTHYVGCIYNSAASTWDAVAVVQEA